MTSSALTERFLFTHPHLFLIFHHHRRKKIENDFKMAQHSESFDDIFHFYNFQSNTFLRLYLILTTLIAHLSTIVAKKINIYIKAMRAICL